MDYYEILEVPKDASAAEIKKSFRELAFKYHPDRNAGDQIAEETFKKINEAYSVLSDPEKKRRYDLGGYSTDQERSYAEHSNQQAYGQYTWTYYGPFGFSQGSHSQDSQDSQAWYEQHRQNTHYTKRDAFDYLIKNLITLVVGILLFRFSFFFGIFGIIICISAIGKGFFNSLRAIQLLWNLKKES